MVLDLQASICRDSAVATNILWPDRAIWTREMQTVVRSNVDFGG